MDTFFWHWEFPALGDLDRLGGLVAGLLLDILDLADHIHSLQHLTEDDMAAIQPRGHDGGDEELATIGVLARVGHAWRGSVLGWVAGGGEGHTEKAGAAMLELEVLVGELGAVDGLATSAISTREVATLDHEVLDDTVESRALITKALLTGSQGAEVLSGLEERCQHRGQCGCRRCAGCCWVLRTSGTVLP
jgi:hypothetical protein